MLLDFSRLESGQAQPRFEPVELGLLAGRHHEPMRRSPLHFRHEEAGAAIPDELIDLVSLAGPRDVVRDRLAAFRDGGVGTLMVTPMAFNADDRIEQLRAVAELAG